MGFDNPAILPSFVAYLALMLAIGALCYRRTESLPDYILGGRRLGVWVASMSAQASDMSGWLLLGLPGYAYVAGLPAFWIALGLVAGTYLNWRVVAARLRRFTKAAGDSLTISDYLEHRFLDGTSVLRAVSAVFIIVFFLVYTASGFVASAKLFTTVFGWSYGKALLVGAAVVMAYTCCGGFMAVCWTDLIQALLMFFALLAVPLVALARLGGWGGMVEALGATQAGFLRPFTTAQGESLSVVAIVSLLAWGLGYFGQPHILARFMAVRSPRHITPARRIAMVWVVLCLWSAVMVGLVGRAWVGERLGVEASETVFMVMVDAHIPAALAGVALSAILAAIMSTADSQLLVTSSAITQDLYRAWLRRSARERELVWVGRLSVLGVAGLALLIARDPTSSVLKLVAHAWGGFGATFGPVILGSLFWRRMTRAAALAGLVTGGVVVVIWARLHGGIFELYEIVPGFLLSCVAILVTGLLSGPPKPQVLQVFDAALRAEE